MKNLFLLNKANIFASLQSCIKPKNNLYNEEHIIITCISRILWYDKLRCDHDYYHTKT